MAKHELAALLRSARELNGAGRYSEALEAARLALRHSPDDPDSKRVAARLLGRFPAAIQPEWRDDIARLAVDPAIDPMMVAPAGWHLLLAPGGSVGAHSGDPRRSPVDGGRLLRPRPAERGLCTGSTPSIS